MDEKGAAARITTCGSLFLYRRAGEMTPAPRVSGERFHLPCSISRNAAFSDLEEGQILIQLLCHIAEALGGFDQHIDRGV